ncbi:ABC transporter permease [Christensenella timonensis]|uniref:ABC transporter permease n=1 Tax=Christensenella timonensis TaxID=1816678 RepID=UPI0008367BE6|nr:ABC transporter permease [Christensenella timonensis]
MQSSSKSLWKKFDLQKGIVYIAIVVAFLVFTILLGDTGFLKPINQVNILRQMSTIGIMCFGMVFVIGCGQIDLTVGANVAMSGIVAALVMQSGGNAFVAVLAALGTGALIGLINGGILVGTGLPSFLITIGTMTILKGLSMWVANSQSIPIYDKTYSEVFGNGTVFGIPVMIIWCIVCLIIAFILLKKIPFGPKVLAVGGNEQAARYSGVNVKDIKLKVMLLSGLFSSFAGILYSARLEAANYVYGDGAEMNVIAAVVLGGTSMNGGVATIVGTFVGAWMMAMIDNGLVIAGMSASQQMIIRGIVVIAATALGTISSLRKGKE